MEEPAAHGSVHAVSTQLLRLALSNTLAFDPARSAILAHIVLQEKLNMFGMLGCLLCITGSLTIVLHAPPERHLGSVIEVFQLAMQPGAQLALPGILLRREDGRTIGF